MARRLVKHRDKYHFTFRTVLSEILFLTLYYTVSARLMCEQWRKKNAPH